MRKILMMLVGLSVILLSHSASGQGVGKEANDRSIKRYGWFVPICFIWSNKAYMPVCSTVDRLIRLFPSEVSAVSAEVSAAIQKSISHSQGNFSSDIDMRTRFRTIDVPLGCGAAGEEPGVVRLGEALAETNSRLRPSTQDYFWRLSKSYTDPKAKICANQSNSKPSKSRVIRVISRLAYITAYGEELGLTVNKNFRDEFIACVRGQSQSPAIPAEGTIREVVAKIYAAMEAAVGGGSKDNSGGSGGGVRGYCMPEVMDCGAKSCRSRALVASMVKALRERKKNYDGCGINMTPHPNNPDQCAKDEPILDWIKLDENPIEASRRCRQDWVAIVLPGAHGLCGGQLPEKLGTEWPGNDPCYDPRALCAEDNIVLPGWGGPPPPIPTSNRNRSPDR